MKREASRDQPRQVKTYQPWITETTLQNLIDLDPNNPSHQLSKVMVVEGKLNIRALQRAVDMLPQQHHILRSYYHPKTGHRMEAEIRDVDSTIRRHDLRGSEDVQQLEKLISSITCRSMDLTKPPLFSFDLIQLADDETVLITQISHKICDGMSAGILFYEIAELYNAQMRWAFLNVLSQAVSAGELGFWFATKTTSLFLAEGWLNPPGQWLSKGLRQATHNYAQFVSSQPSEFAYPPEIKTQTFKPFSPPAEKRLRDDEKQHADSDAVTYSADFSEAFNIAGPFVAKHKLQTSLPKLLFACAMITADEFNDGPSSLRIPYHNRHHEQHKYTVGYLASNKVVEVPIADDMTLPAFIQEFSRQLRHAPHNTSAYPACTVINAAGKTLPQWECNFLDNSYAINFSGLKVTPRRGLQGKEISKTWYGKGLYESKLACFFNLKDGHLALDVTYLKNAYDEPFVRAFVGRFMEIYQAALANPAAKISDIKDFRAKADFNLVKATGAQPSLPQSKAKPATTLYGRLWSTVRQHPLPTLGTVAGAAVVGGLAARRLMR